MPSLSDLFFLFVAGWMFLINPLSWQRLLADADTFLHVRIGQYILSTGTVPHQDLFSFSKPGQAWYAFEWLSEAAFAWAFNHSGFKGLALIGGVLILLYVTLLLKYTLWKGANGLIALLITLFTATATSIHYLTRPHLFTLLFLTIAIWILEYNRRRGGRFVWALVPLTVLWANLHGGFFIFFALLGIRAAACMGEGWFWPELRQARRRETIQLAGMGACCGIASLLNPYGIHLHAHILETLRSSWIVLNVSEFKSPVFRSEPMYDFMILMFAGLACLTPLIRKRSIVEPLWILFLAYCSLTSVRHSTIFLLVAAPIVAVELSEWWAKLSLGRSRASLLGMLADVSCQLSLKLPGTGLFIPAAIVGLAVAPGIQWPTGFPAEAAVPIKMIEPHLDLVSRSRVFTSDQIADYLIFRNYPRQRVFIDSRHNYYGDKIGNDYMAINNGGPPWRSLLDQYGFNLILCDADAPLAALVKASGGWRIVEEDSKYILFEREKKG